MSLRNDLSKHRVFVQRLAGTEAASIKAFLGRLKYQAVNSLNAGTTGKELTDSLRKTMEGLHKVAVENMTDVASYEASFIAKTLNKYVEGTVATTTDAALRKSLITDNISVNNVKFKSGGAVASVNEEAKRKSLATAYKQFGQRKADDIAQIMKDAQVKGLTRAETLAAIEERINGLHTSQAKSLASLSVNYSTNIAKSQVIAENRDIIAQEQWVRDTEADSCSECESLNGQIGDVGTLPSAPIHWGCRCEVIPYVG